MLEIDVNGAETIRRRIPEALVVLLVPPSPHDQEARLRGRGDDEEHVRARLAMAAEEEARGRSIADAVVVNDHLERAVEEVAAIVERRRREGLQGSADTVGSTGADRDPAGRDTTD